MLPATTSSAARGPAAATSPKSAPHRTTSYSDTSAAAGTSYSYRVRANDAALNLGPYSNTATATTTASATYSIGGTVSGLSGTVVLQDNGGDDLSVSSDGPFTFARPGRWWRLQRHGQDQPQRPDVHDVGRAWHRRVGERHQRRGHVHRPDSDVRRGRLQPARWWSGRGWTAISDGGLVDRVPGGARNQRTRTAGDIRTAESYGSDQFSQIEVTSTQLTGGEWIGPTVRSQNGGQDTYLGIYFWNNGNPQLRLYKRTAGTFIQLGNSYNSGPLPAGTKLTLSAVGSTIYFQQDGTTRIAATDTTLTGGAPGLMTFGAATADNWTGGTPPRTFSVGGTVSGLSGTVVLQDNGGDDLSVSSDGPFTFARSLVDGGAYNVTVKSSPSGQTCTTSGALRHRRVGERHQRRGRVHRPTATSGADDFNRPDGGLGADWTAISDGGLSIASQAVLGTSGRDGGRHPDCRDATAATSSPRSR